MLKPVSNFRIGKVERNSIDKTAMKLLSIAAFISINLLSPATATHAVEPAFDPFEKQITQLETVVVETMHPLDRLSAIDKHTVAFDKLPNAIRDRVGLKFYLVEKKSGRIISGEATLQIRLALDDQKQGLVPVILTTGGEVVLPASFQMMPRSTMIVSNTKSNALGIRPKIYVKLPGNGPLRLGHLRDAADPFLEAHKLFAGVLFRAFIGSTKPNCFGFSFEQPASLSISDQGSHQPRWESPESQRIMVPARDIAGFSDNAEIRWTGNSPPERVISCLISQG